MMAQGCEGMCFSKQNEGFMAFYSLAWEGKKSSVCHTLLRAGGKEGPISS